MTPETDDAEAYLAGLVQPPLQKLSEFPAPTFATAQGACLGVGLGLLLATDVVYVAENAKFGSPFAKLGATLDSGGHWYFTYVVEEAVNAGLTDLLMITGRNKRALEDHFDREPGLERALELKGDLGRLDLVQQASKLGPIHYVRQGEPKGLGDAVLCASQHVGNEPLATISSTRLKPFSPP